MTPPLARWLTDHRETLLQRWMAQMNMLQHANAQGNGALVPAEERQVLLGALYDGLIGAVGGDEGPLKECLRHLRALRTQPGEDELPQLIAMMFQFRGVVQEAITEDVPPRTSRSAKSPVDQLSLVDELHQILDRTAIAITTHWTTSARTVARELTETKLLVESLYHDVEAADRTALQVSILNQMAQGLSASFDRIQQLTIVGNLLKSTLEIAHVSIWLYNASEQRLSVARYWDDAVAADTADFAAWHVNPTDSFDLAALGFQSSDVVAEGRPDPATQGEWHRSDCAVLAVPMIAQHLAIGVIVCQDPHAQTLLDRAQQDFVKSAASQMAIALENARLYEEVRSFNAILEQRIAERTRELQIERDTLETLYAIALEVSSTLDRDMLLNYSLNALAKMVGVAHGSIMLVEPDTGHLVHCAVLDQSEKIEFNRFPMGQGIVGWVAQHKKPAFVPDVSSDPRWVSLPEHSGRRKKTGSMIGVPLIAHHEVLGVLVLSHDDVGHFREEHLRLLSASAGQIAIGIHNALLYAEIERQLMHRGDMLRRQEEVASQSTAILQSLSDGVLVCNADGGVLVANPAAERILDRPIEELVVWRLPELMKRLMGRRVEDLPVEELLMNPTDEEGRRSYSTTFQIGMRMISVKLDPVITSKDELMGAVAVFRDITREVESDRLKTEFIGTVSHELRTPMTSIKGFTQLLAMGSLGPVNDTQKEFLSIIQTNAERMISIINDLLDITKIETGSVELDLRPLYLAEMISNVVLELQSSLRAREHELSLSIPPGLPQVHADAKRFNQILYNLLSNAIKYTPRGGKIALEAHEVNIELAPEHLREGLKLDRRYIQIDVRDKGVGIGPEDIDRIFDRFYRTENPLKVEAGGTGLGLSLVRPLIELFGGRIWVQSIVGEGSTFSFVIPAV